MPDLPAHPLFKNLAGHRFGRLLVCQYAGRAGKSKVTAWLCQCDCGNEITIKATNLQGGTKSCGCLHREATGAINRTHGKSKTREYRIWAGIITRCQDPTHKSFKHYGGRGITICSEWRNSFAAFLAHVGPRPSPGHQIDRIDNSRGYEPGNVRWVSRTQNARNKRSNHMITFNGTTKCLSEWTEETGLARHVIWKRLRSGWPVEQALTLPCRQRSDNPQKTF